MRTGVPDRPTAGWSDGAEWRGADAPRGRDGRADDLARRLESLPDGHPSSPYDADGTPRETPARLRHLDTEPDSELDPDDNAHPDQPRPYTDPEWADHKTEVRANLREAHDQRLDTHLQFTVGPDNREWTWERNQIQGQLVADLYREAKDVPCDGQAVIAGGLGGAGKTTVLEKHAGINLSQYLVINPDTIKEEMARRGLVPQIHGLSPMEASQLAHEEASHIAKRLALRAAADHKNVI